MIVAESDYLDHIRKHFPKLDLENVDFNRDGMVNVAVIVNRERVFRFPREVWGIELLQNEMRVLDLVKRHVEILIPDWDFRSDEMISYPFIQGDPLLTDDVLRMSVAEKDAVAEKLGLFLKQIHSIPLSEVEAAGIDRSTTERTADDWLQFYDQIKEHLFPLMWEDGREWVRRHFAPLVEDHSLVHYDPVFMNGDLATYHLLFDRSTNLFKGIIDFGTAGVGDPAVDFATTINQYGESFLRRMSTVYPEVGDHIRRARFRAGTLELQWLLQGILHKDNGMMVVHIGRARDAQPIDSSW